MEINTQRAQLVSHHEPQRREIVCKLKFASALETLAKKSPRMPENNTAFMKTKEK